MQQNIVVLGLNVFLMVYAKLQFSTPNMLNFTKFMRGGLAVFTWQHLTMDDAEVAGIAQYVAVADAAAFTFMLHAKHGLASAMGEAANLYTVRIGFHKRWLYCARPCITMSKTGWPSYSR